MRKIVATLALIALIGYGWHLFRQMTKLDQRVSAAEQTNQNLEETVNLAREQAEQSLDAIEAAEQLQRQTREQAAAESSRAAQAAQDRAKAEGAQQRALQTIAASQTAVEQAAAAAERQRRERREEWQRLGSAMRKIAPTETGATRHRVDLSGLRQVTDGAFDGKSRETLSRLAGALLANYGYAAQLNGTEARAIRDYLVTAGVPGDSLSLAGSPGENQLDLFETVLTHH
ncbi:MAG: hypothetical protein O3A53_01280 [Acidobacteria bacterium]|nr:hypothetical protein [Acidobacteriota bacterium]MDA1233413.1 hypothetical protein [Acidobacteriota bacterium]